MKKCLGILCILILVTVHTGCSITNRNPNEGTKKELGDVIEKDNIDNDEKENIVDEDEDKSLTLSFESPEMPKGGGETAKIKAEDPEDSPKVYQEYSFGPNIDPTNIDKETKDFLQTRINELGNPQSGEVTINGFNAYYLDNSLVVEVFIRNGTGYKIFNLQGPIKIKKNDEIIASGEFVFSEEEFGFLVTDMSRVWKLVFTEDSVNVKNADLSEYSIYSTLQYNY